MKTDYTAVPEAKMAALFNLLTGVPGVAYRNEDLRMRLGLGKREVELIVQALRVRWGAPIRSGSAGYWWPRDRAEALLVADELRERALTQHRTEGAVRRGVDFYFPASISQMELTEV
ncbi:MAG: hypothetical protein HRF49_07570 [bacterium]|jgi:biotin operon repressor